MSSKSNGLLNFAFVILLLGAFSAFVVAGEFYEVRLLGPLNNANFSGVLTTTPYALVQNFTGPKVAALTFNVSVIGTVNTSATNWTILSNFTGVWAFNASNSTTLLYPNGTSVINASFNFTTVNVTEGQYIWTVNASNGTIGTGVGNGSLSNSSNNFTFFVDFTPPVWSAITPLQNGTNTSVNYFLANVSVNDSLTPIDSCIINNVASNNVNSTSRNGNRITNCANNYTSLSDGWYNFTVYFNDSANNLNSSTQVFFQIDTTKPAAINANTTGGNLANNSNSSANYVFVNYTLTEKNPQGCTLSFNNGTVTNFTMSNAFGGETAANRYCFFNVTSQTVNLGGLRPNYTVFVNDSAGNTNASNVQFVTLDISQPGITLVSPTPGNASNTSVNYVFFNTSFSTGITGLSACTLVVNQTVNYSMAVTSPLASPTCSYNLTTLADSAFNWTIYVNDSAGNVNNSGVRSVRVDTTKPAAINANTTGGNLANNSNSSANYVFVNYTFTEATPSNCTLSFNNGTVTNFTMTPSFTATGGYCFFNVTSQTANLGGLRPNYTVTVADGAGNTNASNVQFVTLDISQPGITLVSPTPGNASNTSVNYVFFNTSFSTGITGLSACTLVVNQTVNYSMAVTSPLASPTCSYNLTTIANSAFNWTIYVNDSAGNVNNSGVRSVRVETTAPSNLATNPSNFVNNSNTSSFSPTLNFTFVEPNAANCTIQWNNGTVQNLTGTLVQNTTGGYCSVTVNNGFNLTSGQKANYTAFVFNGPGLVGASALVSLNFDNTSPTTPQVTTGTLANFTNTTFNYVFVNFSFTETNPNNCTLTFNTTNYTMNLFGNGSSAYCSYNVTTLVDGLHNYTVTAIDLSGNSNTTSTFTQLVDSVRPAAVVFASPSMANATNTSVNYVFFNATFTELNAKNCSLVVDGANSSPTAMTLVGANTSAPYCFVNVTSAADGLHNATVIVTDSAGNQNGTILGFVRVDTTYPKALSFVSPSANNSNTSSNYVFVNVSLNMTNPANCTLQFNNGTGNANYTMALTGSGSATYCSFNVTSNFTASGNYDNFSVYASSGAGLTNATGLRYVLYDTGAPSVSLTSPATGVTLTSTPALAFTYSDALTQGTCWAYVDGSTTGSQSGLTGAGSITPVGVGNAPHTWFVNCIDNAGNSGNSSSREFSLAPGSSTTTTPAATVAPVAVPVSSGSSSSGGSSGGLIPSSGGSPEVPAAVEKTESLGASSSVSGSFTDTSTTLTVAYTAPSSGFSGEVTYHMPLSYDDYQAGLVKITPEPKSVARGSIIATWDVNLAPKETFQATVEVAKPLNSSVLKQFKAPSVVSKGSVPSSKPVASAAPTQSVPQSVPKPAQADNTLWYVLGALVLLGVLYFVFVGSKPKVKGL